MEFSWSNIFWLVFNGAYVFLRDVVVPLGWPLLFVALSLIFKRELRSLIDRIKVIGPNGIEAEGSVRSPTAIWQDVIQRVSETAEAGLHPWLSQIRSTLEARPELGTHENMMKALAHSQRLAFSENVLRLIFGSQIEALQRMASGPKAMSDLQDLFDRHRSQAADHSIPTAEMWVGFLIHANLARVENGDYEASEFGRSFLDLLTASGMGARSKAW